ncbi:methyltransferase family protein [Belliella baltica DSM 15883]|uniref:Methyltransferase family protein n=1 Tax=Belliella baltica (strain DSM 15883 / CIP 108006 / LMG 21964 / BA134) TaxID=866536 RepID=I3Z332_BELBD|nr:class I SAM-dependent methyltransferase [Belliella baltica]AFL83650.1 methyltransferase family protein [Belliella baltica DSM 15883]
MNKRLTKCPLCKSGLFLNHFYATDHSVSKEIFRLCKCSNCELIFTNPRPDKLSIGKYYQFEDYISHQDKSNNITNRLYKQVRKITLNSKIKLLKKYTLSNSNILDYGCGTGYFLQKAQENGYKIDGIEPNNKAREIAGSLGLKISKQIDEIEDSKKFDTITLFHVLEHIHGLRKTLQSLLKKLKKEGTLIIAVPNIDSWDAKHYKENWAALDVPRHLYHFNQKSMSFLAEEMKLSIVDKKPMPFDSYYVSILSEQHIHPNESTLKTYLKAVKNGFISNKWAKSNENNYSSILYILKKK